MGRTAPRYLLFSDTQDDNSERAGSWSFVLEPLDGTGRLEVADHEPEVRGERLKLLAVVRGLEAIDQPSEVTLITPNRFIGRGIRNGLAQWRDNGWQWERFGVMAPIKNADLWRRIGRANRIHRIDCRVWNFNRYLDGITDAVTTSSQPVVRSYRHHKNSRFSIPTWTEIASTVADHIIPSPTEQVFGCA